MKPCSRWLVRSCFLTSIIFAGCTASSHDFHTHPEPESNAATPCSEGADADSNLRDYNCDGFVDEGRVVTDSVIISELMVDPLGAENYGQYIELYNTNLEPVDPINWSLEDDHGRQFSFGGSTILDGESYLLMGLSSETAINGGYEPEVVYSNIILPHDVISLKLMRGKETMHELHVDLAMVEGVRVGRSITLDPSVLKAPGSNGERLWCGASTAIEGDEYGTPGETNDFCPQIDHDGDSYLRADGDCDDSRAEVHPRGTEICGDGIDQDCSGTDLSCVRRSDWTRNRMTPPQTITRCMVHGDGAHSKGGADRGSPGRSNENCIQMDFDGDGISTADGDCNDEDAAVHPDAKEICDDGIDQDCNGARDDGCSGLLDDKDGDGYSTAAGDCNDADGSPFPGAPDDSSDLGNLKDNDCDGIVDGDPIEPGDVIFAEIMKNPPAVANTEGEWFEVFNTTERDIDLRNWIVTDVLGHSITISSSLVVKAGWQIVLGVNADRASNGGVPVDYKYHGLVLPNDGPGGLSIKVGGQEIDSMAYDDAYPDKFGQVMQLDLRSLYSDQNDGSSHWCLPVKIDYEGATCQEIPGSPGLRNTACCPNGFKFRSM